ncbi:hypothetical protein GCM10011369_23100 [Neiella marina]|uniref:Uncharacterized protein n=1 Tax=Neiella marina TaxID=508461 RepID=A0A8J2U5Z1_9GAMM|nr:hypothetical protein [Neiella marina]GGA80549.1 hypothetical protein GCM10011369_23100 [Neiella marina]
MDQKTKELLQKTIEVCQALLDEKPFKIQNSEICCVPNFLACKTPTEAKIQNLVLKQRAKPVGLWDWYHPNGGWITGKLYLGKSFKAKENG